VDGPRLSVVVASFRARTTLDACLTALLSQCPHDDVELLLARSDDRADLDDIARAYPTVRVIRAPSGADIPRLRGAGLQASAGALSLMIEDHCVADAEWVASFRPYLDTNVDVIGGGMDNAQAQRAIDWGAFFSEYGFFSALTERAASAPGGVPLLTAANVAYAGRVRHDVAAWMSDGLWENVVHERLRAKGATLRFEPRARVGQNLRYGLIGFLADRYRHGFDYARVRLAETPGMNRLVRALITPLLAPLLTWRVARATVGSSSRAWSFVRALPFTMAFLGAWTMGEAAGYARGPVDARDMTGVTR